MFLFYAFFFLSQVFTTVTASLITHRLEHLLNSKTGNKLAVDQQYNADLEILVSRQDDLVVIQSLIEVPYSERLELQSALRASKVILYSEYLPRFLDQNGLVWLGSFAKNTDEFRQRGRFRYPKRCNLEQALQPFGVNDRYERLVRQFRKNILPQCLDVSREEAFIIISKYYDDVYKLVKDLKDPVEEPLEAVDDDASDSLDYLLPAGDEMSIVTDDEDADNAMDEDSSSDISKVISHLITKSEAKVTILKHLLPSICQTWDGNMYHCEHRYDYISRLVWLIHSKHDKTMLWEDNCETSLLNESAMTKATPNHNDSSYIGSLPVEIQMLIFGECGEFGVALQLTCKSLYYNLDLIYTTPYVYHQFYDLPLSRIRRRLYQDLASETEKTSKDVCEFIKTIHGRQIFLQLLPVFDSDTRKSIGLLYENVLRECLSPYQPVDAFHLHIRNLLLHAVGTPEEEIK